MKNKFFRFRQSLVWLLLVWTLFYTGAHAAGPRVSDHMSKVVDSLPTQPELSDFLFLVKKNHPLALQAALLPKRALAEQLKAKGAFDPVIGGQAQQKYFDGKEYFSQVGGELKVPTWIGAELKGGFETNRGFFLSPESNTPTGGLFYGGVAVPLGRGLLIDERRVAVKTADLKWQAAKAKQENSINELLYEASLLYWEWFRSYHTLETWKVTLENAKQRYKATQGIVRTGERPMIDTVDAGVQLQNLTLGKLQAEAEWQKQRIQLAAFVWDDEQATYGLPDYTLPPLLKVNALPDPRPLIPAEGDRFSHPYLEQLAFVSKEIDLQKKWATDRFKPTVQLQYMPLAEAVGSPLLSQFSLNNYKWGMEVKVPLLFRKERADLQLAKVRDLENTLEIADKQAQLRAKLNANYAMWNNYRDQVSVSFTTVQQYQQLYEAEARLFAIGESTLFMVNLRELAYLQAKLKLVDVITKYNVTLSDIHYAAGKMALLAEPGN